MASGSFKPTNQLKAWDTILSIDPDSKEMNEEYEINQQINTYFKTIAQSKYSCIVASSKSARKLIYKEQLGKRK